MILTLYYTGQEILQQSELWIKGYDLIMGHNEKIREFISDFLQSNIEVHITSISSSIVVEDSISDTFQMYAGIPMRAISITDIVTCPKMYLTNDILKISNFDYQKLVCLSLGTFLYFTREMYLEIQELVKRKIIGVYDTVLGFRTVVSEKALVIYIICNVIYSIKYNCDLIKSIKETLNLAFQRSISKKSVSLKQDKILIFTTDWSAFDEELLTLIYLIQVQLISLYKAIGNGLNSDSPSEIGANIGLLKESRSMILTKKI